MSPICAICLFHFVLLIIFCHMACGDGGGLFRRRLYHPPPRGFPTMGFPRLLLCQLFCHSLRLAATAVWEPLVHLSLSLLAAG